VLFTTTHSSTTPSSAYTSAPSTTAELSAEELKLLTVQVEGHHLSLPNCTPVPRRLRGVPLILPRPTEMSAVTHATLSNAQLLTIPTKLLSSPPINQSVNQSPTTMCHLEVLNVSYNAIRALPESEGWAALVSLRELDVSHNLLKSLPRTMGGAANLHKLNLRSNQLRSWAEGCAPALEGLQRLQTLDLRYNPRLNPRLTASKAALDKNATLSALDEPTLRRTLPGAVVGAAGHPAVLLGAEPGVPIRRGSPFTSTVKGDGPGAGWPSLLAQLAPLSTPVLLHRMHSFFG